MRRERKGRGGGERREGKEEKIEEGERREKQERGKEEREREESGKMVRANMHAMGECWINTDFNNGVERVATRLKYLVIKNGPRDKVTQAYG